jgi:hypothetical protein
MQIRHNALHASTSASLQRPASTARPAQSEEASPSRLDAIVARSEARLEALAGDKDLSPRQQQALLQAKEELQSLHARLEQAFGGEGRKPEAVKQALSALQAHFASGVAHILSGGVLDASGGVDLRA